MELLSINGASTKKSVEFSTNRFLLKSAIKDGEIIITYKNIKENKHLKRFIGALFQFIFYVLISTALSQGNTWCIASIICAMTIPIFYFAIMCKSSFPKFHAAEHRVHNTYINGKELTINNVKNASNLSLHCGANYVFFCVAIIITLLLVDYFLIHINIFIVYFLFVGLIEVYFMNNKYIQYLIYPIKRFGLITQKILTTRDPEDIQIQVALRAMLKLLELEAMALENEGSHESLEGDFFA